MQPMPGRARPVHLYSLVDPSPGHSRGQRRGITRVDPRTREGRLIKLIRKEIIEHLTADGSEPTFVQKSLAERAAWLELRCTLFDRKEIEGKFTDLDSRHYLALVGSLRRLYKEIGLSRPTPKFSEFMKRPKKDVA